MTQVPTDVLLVRCRMAQPDGLHIAARRLCAEGWADLVLQRLAWSDSTGWAYAYCGLPATTPMDASVPAHLAMLWSDLCPAAQDVDVSRLEMLQDAPGRSHGDTALRHYVVETDPEPGWEEELARWYAQEHMPGLAGVPGCVHARRFRNHDAGPASHASYALVSEDTLGSPPWLAVRGTEWSSRVRPHFTRTRRTMMTVMDSPR